MEVKMSILFFWIVILCADLQVDTNISEKHTISTFSPENGDSMFLKNADMYVCISPEGISTHKNKIDGNKHQSEINTLTFSIAINKNCHNN
jgi:hypothetical protein